MSKTKTGLSSGTANWVRNNIRELRDVPKGTWKNEEVGVSASTLHKLRAEDLIKIAERDKKGGHTFRTIPKMADAIEIMSDRVDDDGFLPCNHGGFVNRGDTLECKICGTEHSKAEVSL